MRYDQINIARLEIAIATLRESRKRLQSQGVLGISEGRCCNHTRVKIAEDECEVGCLVGILVGIGNFPEGSCDTAMGLPEDKIKMAFRNATINNLYDYAWNDFGLEDRTAYRKMLSGLQNLHDSSPRFSISTPEFVLFVLTAMLIRFEAIRSETLEASTLAVEWFPISIQIGDHYETPNSIIAQLQGSIENFIIKK